MVQVGSEIGAKEAVFFKQTVAFVRKDLLLVNREYNRQNFFKFGVSEEKDVGSDPLSRFPTKKFKFFPCMIDVANGQASIESFLNFLLIKPIEKLRAVVARERIIAKTENGVVVDRLIAQKIDPFLPTGKLPRTVIAGNNGRIGQIAWRCFTRVIDDRDLEFGAGKKPIQKRDQVLLYLPTVLGAKFQVENVGLIHCANNRIAYD